jgi:hypothetical protein
MLFEGIHSFLFTVLSTIWYRLDLNTSLLINIPWNNSAMKKDEIWLFAGKSMEQESIMVSEISQAQKTKHRLFSPICAT